MKKPTRRERRQLQRLRKPGFTVKIDEGEVVRQLERHVSIAERSQ